VENIRELGSDSPAGGRGCFLPRGEAENAFHTGSRRPPPKYAAQ